MDIKSFGLAWVVVSDLKKAKKFFKETLGLKVDTEDDTFGWMECSGSEKEGAVIGIAQHNEHATEEECPVVPGGNAVITLSVEDIVKARKELQQKGVRLVGEIIEVPGHVKMQTFADPDGNIYQLVQKLD